MHIYFGQYATAATVQLLFKLLASYFNVFVLVVECGCNCDWQPSFILHLVEDHLKHYATTVYLHEHSYATATTVTSIQSLFGSYFYTLLSAFNKT